MALKLCMPVDSLYLAFWNTALLVPSNHLILSQVQNFITQQLIFVTICQVYLKRYNKNLKTHIPLKIILFDLALCKKLVIWFFLKICTWSLFVTKLNLKISQKRPTRRQLTRRIYSYEIWKEEFYQKIRFFHFNVLFGRMTKLEAIHWCFVIKLYPLKPSPFCENLNKFLIFGNISALSSTF